MDLTPSRLLFRRLCTPCVPPSVHRRVDPRHHGRQAAERPATRLEPCCVASMHRRARLSVTGRFDTGVDSERSAPKARPPPVHTLRPPFTSRPPSLTSRAPRGPPFTPSAHAIVRQERSSPFGARGRDRALRLKKSLSRGIFRGGHGSEQATYRVPPLNTQRIYSEYYYMTLPRLRAGRPRRALRRCIAQHSTAQLSTVR